MMPPPHCMTLNAAMEKDLAAHRIALERDAVHSNAASKPLAIYLAV